MPRKTILYDSRRSVGARSLDTLFSPGTQTAQVPSTFPGGDMEANLDLPEKSKKRKVLVVEDHQNIANLLKLHLQLIGCEVTLAADGTLGLTQAESESYDLIILDLMLPGIDGLEICRHLRANTNYTPILMLTAKSDEAARIVGLDSGADDYLGKPFSIAELIARVKALFRRLDTFTAKTTERAIKSFCVGDLKIDEAKRRATLRGNRLDLTLREFDLLLVLAQNPGRAFSRSQLLDLVWSYNYVGFDSTVKSHINRLRTKIEDDPANPKYILTVWGVGYAFAERTHAER